MGSTTAAHIKVSVIIPVYNVEKYLRECLDSLIPQTLKDIEIICIDDCSTDDSTQIMREYAARDPRIKNIFLETNGGQGLARNIGIEYVTGKYVFFLDSDDMIPLDALEILYHLAESTDAEQVMFLPQILSEYKNTSLEKYYTDYPEELTGRVYNGVELLSTLLKTRFFPAACLKFSRSELAKNHGKAFVEGYILEDNYFSVKSILFAKKAIVINDKLYIRRIRENSTMTSDDSKANMRHICGYAAVIGTFQTDISHGMYNDEQKKVLQLYCSSLINHIMKYAKKLTHEERENFLQQLPDIPWGENWQFVIPTLFKFSDAKNNLEKAEKQNRQLRASVSYRLGRALTWLPRKFRSMVRRRK